MLEYYNWQYLVSSSSKISKNR